MTWNTENYAVGETVYVTTEHTSIAGYTIEPGPYTITEMEDDGYDGRYPLRIKGVAVPCGAWVTLDHIKRGNPTPEAGEVIPFDQIKIGDRLAAVGKSEVGQDEYDMYYITVNNLDNNRVQSVRYGSYNADYYQFTLVERPKPPLPSELGSVIYNVNHDGHAVLADADMGLWFSPAYGAFLGSTITDWTATP